MNNLGLSIVLGLCFFIPTSTVLADEAEAFERGIRVGLNMCAVPPTSVPSGGGTSSEMPTMTLASESTRLFGGGSTSSRIEEFSEWDIVNPYNNLEESRYSRLFFDGKRWTNALVYESGVAEAVLSEGFETKKLNVNGKQVLIWSDESDDISSTFNVLKSNGLISGGLRAPRSLDRTILNQPALTGN